MSVELGADGFQVLAHERELFGAAAEHLLELVAGRGELLVGPRELRGARPVFREQARGLDRDGRLVGEGREGRQLGLEAVPGAKPRLEVERADGNPLGWGATDGDARDRLDHELVDADRLGQAQVVTGSGGDHGLARPNDRLSDRPRERRVRFVARRVAGGVYREVPLLAPEHDETALGAEQVDGVVGDLRQQARQVMFGGELAHDLEDVAELGVDRSCQARPASVRLRDRRVRGGVGAAGEVA